MLKEINVEITGSFLVRLSHRLKTLSARGAPVSNTASPSGAQDTPRCSKHSPAARPGLGRCNSASKLASVDPGFGPRGVQPEKPPTSVVGI